MTEGEGEVKENAANRVDATCDEKLKEKFAPYAKKWALTDFDLISHSSQRIVWRCCSQTYGNTVLKMSEPSVLRTEYYTLRQYEGTRFCKVFEVDLDNGVLLLEDVVPGTSLRNECSLDKRIDVFCSLYKNLHMQPLHANVFPSYFDWVVRICEYMRRRENCVSLFHHISRARDICLELSLKYSQKQLLHGDLHHDNILLSQDGNYRIIDPKGVIGDPIFDVPRFILNEFTEERNEQLLKKINTIIDMLEQQLHIPNDSLRKCLYIETAMGMCWYVESGASATEYPMLLEQVQFAQSIMNG